MNTRIYGWLVQINASVCGIEVQTIQPRNTIRQKQPLAVAHYSKGRDFGIFKAIFLLIQHQAIRKGVVCGGRVCVCECVYAICVIYRV